MTGSAKPGEWAVSYTHLDVYKRQGKGVSFMEDQFGWHGSPMNKEQFEKALSEQEVE